eukprot:scaffold57952_cov59-Attheya_sp.AAC.2
MNLPSMISKSLLSLLGKLFSSEKKKEERLSFTYTNSKPGALANTPSALTRSQVEQSVAKEDDWVELVLLACAGNCGELDKTVVAQYLVEYLSRKYEESFCSATEERGILIHDHINGTTWTIEKMEEQYKWILDSNLKDTPQAALGVQKDPYWKFADWVDDNVCKLLNYEQTSIWNELVSLHGEKKITE